MGRPGRPALKRFQELRDKVTRFEFANPQQEEFVLSTSRETLADGGVGCVSAETLIAGVPAAEWTGGIVFDRAASGAFLKGVSDLYRVTTQSGRQVVVTAEHRFLTPTGWRPLQSLHAGDCIGADGTLHEVSARGKPTYSLVRCSEESHQYDGLPHPVEAAFLDKLQQFRMTVCGRNASGFYTDLLSRNHYAGRLQGFDFSECLSWIASDEQPLPVESADHNLSGFPSKVPQKDSGKRFPHMANRTLVLEIATSVSSRGANIYIPLSYLDSFWDEIQDISFVRHGQFYDLNVPHLGHYSAQGLWHHNSGKTIGGLTRLLILAEKFPGSRWFVARQTYKDLTQTTRKSFDRICPPGWIKRDVLNEMTLFNGAEIIWAHLDEYDIKTLMGLEINGAFLDQVEEINPEIYDMLDSRIGRWYLPEWTSICPSYIWGTSNPAGKDWLYFRFHPDANPPDYRKYIFMPTNVNREILDKYHPGYYQNLMKKSPSWKKRWVEASRDIWEGQIFSEFKKGVQTYNPQQFNPFSVCPQGVSWSFMDYGLTSPTTLVITYSTMNYLFAVKEYGSPDKSIKEHAGEIKNLIARNPSHVRGILADPSMFFESTRDRKIATTSIANEYRQNGIYLLKADNNEETSLEILHEMFNVDPAKMNPVTQKPGSPTLFISEDCPNLIKEIEMQRYKEDRNPLTGEKEFIGVRLDTVDDDYFDPLRYFANSKVHQVTAKRPQMAMPSYGWGVRKLNAYAGG